MLKARKTISLVMTLAVMTGILAIPVSADSEKEFKRYSGVQIIDEFLNDERWAEGTPWNSSQGTKLAPRGSSGCCAYVCDYTKYCFGYDNPYKGESYTDINECRVGDVITTGQGSSVGHWAIVIQRDGDDLTIAEGNAMDQVLMERIFTINREENRFEGDRATRKFLKGYHFLPLVTGWQCEDERWFYLDKYGVRVKGWQEIYGKWYFFDSDTSMLTGWQELDVKSIFIDDGSFFGKWIEVGDWYYFGGNGVMRTEWQQVGNDWYYFGGNGIMRKDWQNVGGKWYYFGESGSMKKEWQQSNGSWYYLGGNGIMRTDWQQVGNNWYYLGGNGVMRTGWQQIGNDWYYFGDSGVMRKNWQEINGKWYYFGQSGTMKTGWLLLGSTWYYLDPSSGVMATGTKTINGKTYKFNSSGACTNP